MKIYATLEGEKFENGKYITVKKSQGSNTQLNILINIDSEKPRFMLHINKREDESTDIVLVDTSKSFPLNTVFQEKLKGNKQKGERGLMDECNGDDISCALHTNH